MNPHKYLIVVLSQTTITTVRDKWFESIKFTGVFIFAIR